MKLFVVLAAFILVAVGQIGAKPAKPFNRQPVLFAQLVANNTELMLARDENPSTLATLGYKGSAMFQASFWYGFKLPAQKLISRVTYTATRFLTPDRALADIQELQKNILGGFNRLDSQRSPESSDEVNKLVDDFIDKYSLQAEDEFDKMQALSTKATQDIETVSLNLVALIDQFVMKIDTCSNLKLTEFRQVFQCWKDYHSLANKITPELDQLEKAADQLYSDYSAIWSAFISEFDKNLQETSQKVSEMQNKA